MSRQRTPPSLATLALCLLFGLCCLAPLAWMLLQLLTNPHVLPNLRPSAFSLSLLLRTLFYNGSAALLATILSIPAALVVGRGRGVIAQFLTFLLPLALVMPSIAYTYGWLQFFRLAGIDFVPASPADVLRCIWTLACWLWPLPALAIGLSLRFTDPHIQLQALLDGALARITARLLLGPILASLAIVTVLAMQEFAVYERSGISVLATEIRTVFETGALSQLDPAAITGAAMGSALIDPTQGQRAAAALATGLPLLALIALLSLLAFAAAARLSPAEQIDLTPWPRVLCAGPVPKLLTALLLIITLAIPAASLLLSISPSRWHQGSPLLRILLWAWPYAAGSLLGATLAGLLALFAAALACVRPTRWLLLAALATFLIGGELLAIANIRLYNRPAPWPLSTLTLNGEDPFALIYNNLPVVLLAYLGRFGWLALLAGRLIWTRPFRQLRALAAVDGASSWQIARHVAWGITWPLLLAAAVLVAVLSLTEVSASVLLSPQRPPMLVVTLMGWIHMLRYDDMLEGSLLLMAMALALGLLLLLLLRAGVRLAKRLRAAPILLLLLLLGCDDPKERPEALWCSAGTSPGQFVYPRAIAYSPQLDNFFVVDRSARVQRLSSTGQCLAAWRMPDYDFGMPVGLTVGPDANLYIADTHYHRVMVYTPDGQFLRQWGSFGTAPGQFTFPTDIAFDRTGNIYVSEYGDNDRIQVFDPASLRVLRTIGRFGSAPGEFARPQSLLIDGDTLYVTDSCNHRINVFRTDGTFLRNLGALGSAPGQFRFPYGLDQDPAGNLIITEFGNNRIQILDKTTAQPLRTWGHPGRHPGQLAIPWAVVTDKHNRIIILDSGNNRIQVIR